MAAHTLACQRRVRLRRQGEAQGLKAPAAVRRDGHLHSSVAVGEEDERIAPASERQHAVRPIPVELEPLAANVDGVARPGAVVNPQPATGVVPKADDPGGPEVVLVHVEGGPVVLVHLHGGEGDAGQLLARIGAEQGREARVLLRGERHPRPLGPVVRDAKAHAPDRAPVAPQLDVAPLALGELLHGQGLQHVLRTDGVRHASGTA
mmetsp:Transcript_107378/g.346551  ORF Transcript_107378/g.346551 Transcript_107378/m.346551 type:complete len:206 (-) Transcript_107378:119-736(-)